ncbi:hypothetical protein ACLOJK_027550 [Asimina triloba]
MGGGEWMLLNYLPDVLKELSKLEERIYLIGGCSSQEEYCYHKLGEAFRHSRGATSNSGSIQGGNGRASIPRDPEARLGAPSKWELLEEVLAKARGVARERLEAERELCHIEGMAEGEQHFFFQLLKMGRHTNRAETRQEEAEKTIIELRLILNAKRAELDEAHDDVEGVSLTKQDLEWALEKAKYARGEASRISFELDVVRAEQDKAIGRAIATEEKVLQSSTELVALRAEAEALYTRGTDPYAGEESSHSEEVSILQEQIIVLSSRELELLTKSETIRAKVAWLWMELKTWWAKRYGSSAFKWG